MNASDSIFDEKWLEEYLATVLVQRAAKEKERIEWTCAQLRVLWPDEALVAFCRSTEWISEWTGQVSEQLRPVECVSRIQALGRWWSWLFDRGRIDDNVLACFDPHSDALRQPPLTLHHNLQRRIAQFIQECGPRQWSTQRKLRRTLLNFNVFVHRLHPEAGDFRLDHKVVRAWLRDCGLTNQLHGLHLIAGKTHRFLEYLVHTGDLSENPFRRLRARYDVSSRCELVAGLVRPDGEETMPAPRPKPRFQSLLGPHLEGFIALKRAMGRRYKQPEADLKRFDRFAVAFEPPTTIVTKELVDAWLASAWQLSPTTLKHRFGLVRQFCIYTARLEPRTYVPGLELGPTRTSDFKPYIYSTDEVRALLEAASTMSAGKDPLRPRVFRTVLQILYATGLRIGEALRLRLRDVNLRDGTLLVRETKFFKTRIVPVSKSLSEAIASYLHDRLAATTSPEAYLFLNYHSRPYSPDKFSERFRGLLTAAELPHRHAQRRPRAYDMRHTFAVTNLLRWYREGVDVVARLPLLATFMGHVSVLSTQVYLRATPELLREASRRFENEYGSLIDAPQEVVDVIG